MLYSVGVNTSHGLRRTNADKRRAVEVLLRDEEWGQWNDSEVGRRCGVDHKTVARVRSEIGPILGNSQNGANRTVARGSSTYTMDTAKIGGAPAGPSNKTPASRSRPPGRTRAMRYAELEKLPKCQTRDELFDWALEHRSQMVSDSGYVREWLKRARELASEAV